MNRKPKDQLDKELEELERAYTGLAGEEPPELIDQAVLNRARRETRGASGRRPWSFGWVHGLASAAIIVLAVAIYTHQPDPAATEPLRVAKPPTSKLRDIESEIKPLRIPARQAAPAGAPPTAIREFRVQTPSEAKSDSSGFTDAEVLENAADAAAPVLLEESSVAGVRRAATDEDAQDPEAWLARILELKHAGETERLAQELEAFRQAWPDYPIPPELGD